jgi:hypothetical protein
VRSVIKAFDFGVGLRVLRGSLFVFFPRKQPRLSPENIAGLSGLFLEFLELYAKVNHVGVVVNRLSEAILPAVQD